MTKKMTSPQKSPPTETAAGYSGAGSKPTIQVDESVNATTDTAAAPTLTPPSESNKGDAFGAAVWNSDKRVNGLYATHDARNAWMSIAGTGWVKLTTASDSACEAMTILASNARVKSSRIDYAVDAGLTTEMYVW